MPQLKKLLTKKIIEGAAARALRKTVRTAFSESPTHLENNSGPFTAKKFNFDSVANALATIVFEHPGGPYNKIPLGGVNPNRANSSARYIVKLNELLFELSTYQK